MKEYSQTPISYSDELMHYGIKGMKWGRRKKQYKSTNIRAAIARRQNKKVDKGFEKWKDGAKQRDDAIALGKKANAAKREYEADKSNKDLRKDYRQANKEYKKALRKNTTYRKGAVKHEVLSDRSRKTLSDAKKVKKQLDVDPTNKDLQKQYNKLMSRHDVERAKARRAPEVAANRSRRKASIKRNITTGVKGAVATAAIAGGTYAANRYLDNHEVTLNSKRVRIDPEKAKNTASRAKRFVRNVRKYV